MLVNFFCHIVAVVAPANATIEAIIPAIGIDLPISKVWNLSGGIKKQQKMDAQSAQNIGETFKTKILGLHRGSGGQKGSKQHI